MILACRSAGVRQSASTSAGSGVTMTAFLALSRLLQDKDATPWHIQHINCYLSACAALEVPPFPIESRKVSLCFGAEVPFALLIRLLRLRLGSPPVSQLLSHSPAFGSTGVADSGRAPTRLQSAHPSPSQSSRGQRLCQFRACWCSESFPLHTHQDQPWLAGCARRAARRAEEERVGFGRQ